MGVRVMIVDDQEMIRVGLSAVLEAVDGVDVVDVVSDGLAALESVNQVRPDVVLMDIRMPGIDGIETVRRMRAADLGAQPAIIMLTTFEHDDNVVEALKAGANGFLNKSVGPEELLTSIREVAEGGGALTSGAAAAVISRVVTPPAPDVDASLAARFAQLTAREGEVVRYLLGGGTYDEVARRMFLSPLTVKTHANRAMMKVDARDRAQLIAYAHRAGLTRPSEEL